MISTPQRFHVGVTTESGYNEPSFLGREERLCNLILNGEDRAIKKKFQEHLSGADTPERK